MHKILFFIPIYNDYIEIITNKYVLTQISFDFDKTKRYSDVDRSEIHIYNIKMNFVFDCEIFRFNIDRKNFTECVTYTLIGIRIQRHINILLKYLVR